jgi:hypothetical protein
MTESRKVRKYVVELVSDASGQVRKTWKFSAREFEYFKENQELYYEYLYNTAYLVRFDENGKDVGRVEI